MDKYKTHYENEKTRLWIDESTGRVPIFLSVICCIFLPAENGCRGESRARRQHERNPESGIAVIASLWGIFPGRLLSILDSIAAAIGRSRRLFVLAVIRCPAAGISTASFS